MTDDDHCHCEGDHGLYVWRGDPDWFSCQGCDGRVRPITPAEKLTMALRKQTL